MSSSEGEDFNLDVSGSESDGFEPTVKKVGYRLDPINNWVIFRQASAKVKMAPKLAKHKAPTLKTKPKTASKKKVLVDHDENAEDSAVDDVGEGDASDNDQFGASSSNLQTAAPAKKNKTASETYTKVVYLPTSPVWYTDVSF